MTGSRLRVHLWPALLALATASACTSQPTILPSRDFDRPTDMTFVCMGAFTPSAAGDGGVAPEAGAAPAAGELVVSGRPMRNCHPRNGVDPPASVSARTFAFLPQSSSGQLAVVDADDWSLVDLDPANAGFNQAPLGVLPEQITSSDDGCRLITANHGSCDLSLVDPAALMAPTLAAQYPNVSASTGSPPTTTIVPHAPGGPPLRVFPGEVAFLPHPTADMAGGGNLCPASWSWRALVTFPSCDLVALVDLPSGEIIDGAYVRRKTNDDGKTTFLDITPLAKGEAPVCGAPDCGGVDGGAPGDAGDATAQADAVAILTMDGGAEAGTPPPEVVAIPPVRPDSIAIIPETGRAFVGLANGDAVVALDTTNDALSGWSFIPLAEGALGTNRLRLSIDPYGDKTAGGAMIPGKFVGNDSAPDRQYLYAIARDGSVRVIQVAFPMSEHECETNVDPKATLPPGTTLNDACIPVNPKIRRAGALGPGIRTPSPPIDVAVADVRPSLPDQSESSVGGAHAWVLTANGNVYLANIDPVLRQVFNVTDQGTVQACTTPEPLQCLQEPPPAPNTLRNRNFQGFSLALDPTSGPARVDIQPTEPPTGPRIQSIWTRGTANNATAASGSFNQTSVFFPDPTSVTPQSWIVSWEGPLMTAPRLSGQVVNRPAPILFDPGNDFCRLGVQDGDLVTLTGCTDDNQCGVGKSCKQGNEGTQGAGNLPITGLCLPKGTSKDTCNALLSTVRRYEVQTSRPTALALVPHKDELVRPSLAPCTDDVPSSPSDGGAADGGDGGAGDGGAPDGGEARGPSSCVDPLDPSTSAFQCIKGRCLQPCQNDGEASGCRAGRVCVAFGAEKFCADGPDLAPGILRTEVHDACIGELLGYQVSVGRGFLVEGSATGIRRTEIAVQDPADPTQAICVPDPKRDPRTVMRISMDAPRCQNENLQPETAAVDPATLDSDCNPDAADRCKFSPQQLTLAAAEADTAQAQAAAAGMPITRDQATLAGRHAVALQVANDLLNISKGTSPDPDPCLFVGGPNETDNAPAAHVQALFRNNELQFVMTNLEQPPTGAFTLRFDVHGGVRPATVILPSTVEVTMPARLFLGPVDAMQTGGSAPEVPFLFVVDQRRLGRTTGGGPTRGQLLRIHPLGYAVPSPKGNQPWYEDFSHSNNKFPIQ